MLISDFHIDCYLRRVKLIKTTSQFPADENILKNVSLVAGMDNNTTTLREADLTQTPGDALSLLFEIFIGEFLFLRFWLRQKAVDDLVYLSFV